MGDPLKGLDSSVNVYSANYLIPVHLAVAWGATGLSTRARLIIALGLKLGHRGIIVAAILLDQGDCLPAALLLRYSLLLLHHGTKRLLIFCAHNLLKDRRLVLLLLVDLVCDILQILPMCE
jgi:hypothetical protein